MWKAVIPKFCNYSVKAPFPYHQTFGSGILARGWGQAAGPDLLFSNSNGDCHQILPACVWLVDPKSGTETRKAIVQAACHLPDPINRDKD